jgi:hypothetical protein
MEHGTRVAYDRYGCRCDLCREVIRKHNAGRDRKLSRLPVENMLQKLSSTDFPQRYSAGIKSWTIKGIDVFKADRICCEYGFHPYEIWGDDWFIDSWNRTHFTR